MILNRPQEFVQLPNAVHYIAGRTGRLGGSRTRNKGRTPECEREKQFKREKYTISERFSRLVGVGGTTALRRHRR